MRKLVVWSLLVWPVLTFAQFEPLTYGNKDLPMAVFSSAQQDFEGEAYLITPVFPHLQMQFHLSGPTLYDLFGADDRSFNEKWQEAVADMKAGQGFMMESKVQAVGLSFRRDQKVFRAGMYTEFQGWYFHPVSFYRFLFYGNNSDDFLLKVNDLNFNFEAFHTLYAGMSIPAANDARWGFNFKLYNSAGAFSSTGNKGRIYQKPGTNNYYRHIFEHIRFNVNSSGLSQLVFEDKLGQPSMDSTQIVHDLLDRFQGTNNWGIGLDIAYQKDWSDEVTWAVGLEDFGIIRYTDDNLSLQVEGNFSYEGVYMQFPEQPLEYWGEVKDNFNRYMPSEIHTRAFYRWRPFKLYSSVERRFKGKPGTIACYHPGRDERSRQACPDSYVGAVAFYQNLMGRFYAGLGLYGQYYWAPGSYVRVSMASDTFNAFRLGVGAGWHLGPFNMYVMADNLFGFLDVTNSHGQFVAFGTYWAL